MNDPLKFNKTIKSYREKMNEIQEGAGGDMKPLFFSNERRHFVLIHGAGHGAWCWYKLLPLLEKAGNKVTCMDLAGAGVDQSHPLSIVAFEDYNKPLAHFMSILPEDDKVVLIGHSAGGLSISHSLLNFGDKIEVAIYIAATMLPFGFCTEEDAKIGIPDLSEYGDIHDKKYGLGGDKPPTSVVLREDLQHILLYQLCSIEDKVLASMLLRTAPSRAFRSTKFDLPHTYEMSKVKRVYIKTTYDNMVKPEQQDAMIRNWPPHEVFVIDTDHSPFFSATQQLFEVIVRACTSTVC